MTRRRWFAMAGGLLLPVVIVGGAFAWASWTASSYEQDFKRWNSEQKFKLTTYTAPDATAFGYDGNFDSDVEVDEITIHSTRCNEIPGALETLERVAESRPRPAKLPLEWLAPAYRDAREHDRDRTRVVNAYLEPATEVLTRITKDCEFTEKALHFDARVNHYSIEVEDLIDYGGDASCREEGCIPDGAKDLRRYAALLKTIDREYRQQLDLFRTKECTETSFGDTCDEVAEAVERSLDKSERYTREVGRLTPTSSVAAVNQAADQAGRALKKLSTTVRPILMRQHPGVDKVPEFNEDPASADYFLGAVALVERRQLQEHRNRLIRLGA